MTPAVHRLVEERAALNPDVAAILDGSQCTTYRELNARANTLARRLGESGLRRGALALVRMRRGADLAVVLLAVLKAGASYAWIEPGSAEDIELPSAFCIMRRRLTEEQSYVAIDLTLALRESVTRHGPNLPVLTRGTDVACVLRDASGRPHVVVPHSTITALPQPVAIRTATWDSTPGALDLWLGLMAGATLSVGASPPAKAAA